MARSRKTACKSCGTLPQTLLVRTGRDEQRPRAFTRMTKVAERGSEALHRCGTCKTFFLWQDLPQAGGTGTADAEGLERLPPRKSGLLERLLSEQPVEDPRPYLKGLSFDHLEMILSGRVYSRPRVVQPFVHALVEILAERGDWPRALLRAYQLGSRARAQEILDALWIYEVASLPKRDASLKRECHATIRGSRGGSAGKHESGPR
jgi:hypothetical protein